MFFIDHPNIARALIELVLGRRSIYLYNKINYTHMWWDAWMKYCVRARAHSRILYAAAARDFVCLTYVKIPTIMMLQKDYMISDDVDVGMSYIQGLYIWSYLYATLAYTPHVLYTHLLWGSLIYALRLSWFYKLFCGNFECKCAWFTKYLRCYYLISLACVNLLLMMRTD